MTDAILFPVGRDFRGSSVALGLNERVGRERPERRIGHDWRHRAGHIDPSPDPLEGTVPHLVGRGRHQGRDPRDPGDERRGRGRRELADGGGVRLFDRHAGGVLGRPGRSDRPRPGRPIVRDGRGDRRAGRARGRGADSRSRGPRPPAGTCSATRATSRWPRCWAPRETPCFAGSTRGWRSASIRRSST